MTLEYGISLSKYATFHIGGTAEFFVSATSSEELREAVRWAEQEGQSWRVIGEGSNILFSDNEIKGLTVHNKSEGIDFLEKEDGVFITAQSGTLLDTLVAFACEHSWWGLENLSGIPGTVGAVPIQNVGAYGVEVADLVHSVHVYDARKDESVVLTSEECKFSYRHSLFKEPGGAHYVIEAVVFWLPRSLGPLREYRDVHEYFKDTKEDELSPRALREAVLSIRSRKFPDWHVVGTAGSFFKNPVISVDEYLELRARYPELSGHATSAGLIKIPLGWILDHVCGMRGVREGNVGTYGAQALVLVNYGDATAHEIILFAKKIISCVKEKTNINVEWEVTHID